MLKLFRRLAALAAIIAVAQAVQCGFENGFNRPAPEENEAEKCQEAKQKSFLKIDEYHQEGAGFWLSAEESCEIVDYNGNPNCVQAIVPATTTSGPKVSSRRARRDDSNPQCSIIFGNKRVKISDMTDIKQNEANIGSSGCEEGQTGNILLRWSFNDENQYENVVGSVIKESLDIDAQNNDNEWRICFEESTESLTACDSSF